MSADFLCQIKMGLDMYCFKYIYVIFESTNRQSL